VSKSVPGGKTVSGYPAMPHSMFKRLHAFLQKLPDLFQRTRQLEERVESIERAREREEVR
jgi:UDP-3-O-[3-hydroxymyristoyl] glucosamine N-acyltransferase